MTITRLAVTFAAVAIAALSSSAETSDEMAARFKAEGKSLGEPDENGVYVLTPEGEQVAALQEKERAELGVNAASGWALKPLGAPGGLAYSTEFPKKPAHRAQTPRKPAFRLLSPGADALVVATPGSEARVNLAKECVRHLSAMCGREIKFREGDADGELAKLGWSGRPVVVFGDSAAAAGFGVDVGALKPETAVVKTRGNRVLIAGRGAGVSHALTYFLESLGCRYLWPGKSGKVVPKSGVVAVPDFDLCTAPRLRIRRMRVASAIGGRWGDALGKLGISGAEYEKAYRRAALDHPAHRDFFAWHGVNDASLYPEWEKTENATWKWGHHFGAYYRLYGKDHPDWFALQPDGSRRQDERPSLCMSNPGLIEQAAEDLVREFGENPEMDVLSVCLPDGGNTSPCMCPNCRRLDPANAPIISFPVFSPKRGKVSYVSLTDRVMWFSGEVARRVAAKCPGKRLAAYVYSHYTEPPRTVVPDGNLVLLTCAGSYIRPDERLSARENAAAWSRFANPLLWRPNALLGFSCSAPQNFARAMFDDLELMKANTLVGTDFDCMDDQWATKGLVYYALAKAHLNYAAASYDDVFADYCRAGFGPASAPVMAYWRRVEEAGEKAWTFGLKEKGLVLALDVDAMEADLAEADRLAAGNAEVAERIGFLRTGLEYAKWQKRLLPLYWDKAPNLAEEQEKFRAFIREQTARDPIAVSPKYIGYYDRYLKKPRHSGWGTDPLGPAGSIKPAEKLKNDAVFRAPQKPRPAFVLASPSVTPRIEVSAGSAALRQLADEFAWHLSQMCGRAIAVGADATGPRIVFGDAAAAREFGLDLRSLPSEASVVRVRGDAAFIGGNGAGQSHALTAVLEAMGCRYLWPGRLGKVIPRRTAVDMPALDIVRAPQLKVRRIRITTTQEPGTRFAKAVERLGFDGDALEQASAAARIDRAGNRDFFAWHGVNDERLFDEWPATEATTWKWGHSFGDYAARFSKSHPEWFALQPDGSRSMRDSRPTFCLSNKAFIDQAAADIVAEFGRCPEMECLSVCLQDGGKGMQCLCPACRAWDPSNAPKCALQTFVPRRGSIEYVSLSDRVLRFSNEVQRRVSSALPGKRVAMYVYSYYTEPPVAVEPDPSLVLLSVAGDYSTTQGRSDACRVLAGWSRFGNRLLWRPNSFLGFQTTAPQNFARAMFGDLEAMKANGLVGTDMCCMDDQWALKGLVYYAAAKAHLNYDGLSYDDIVADYCRAGFGPAAADVSDYFVALERMTARAAEIGGREAGLLEAIDDKALAEALDRAAAHAAGDGAASDRVSFLRIALDCLAWQRRLQQPYLSRSPDLQGLQDGFKAFLRRAAAQNPMAVHPRYTGHCDRYLKQPR